MFIIHPLVIVNRFTGEVRITEVDNAEFFGVYEQDKHGNLTWLYDFGTLPLAQSYVARRKRLH